MVKIVNLESMSIKEKVGQKFMIGINSHNIDVIIDLIRKYSIGGVILYKQNYNNYDEMLSVIKRLKMANSGNKMPLFIAIDQEGGRVNRMPSEYNNIKNIYDMSLKDIDLIEINADITGRMLKGLGINMNFAPVLDICDKHVGKVLYKRCFYGEVDDISNAGMKYITGLKNNGIIAVSKHFPGHGATSVDSHFLTPYVYNYNKILERHIRPFENVIRNGVDSVMVSHLVIRKMTDGLPASISSNFIRKYLREKNNFDGLVITDEINMLSRNIIYKFIYMKKAFLSGSDIILMKVASKNTCAIIDKFIKLVSSNSECMKLVDDSVSRIIKVKDKYEINDDVSYDRRNIEEINEEINKLNSLCDGK